MALDTAPLVMRPPSDFSEGAMLRQSMPDERALPRMASLIFGGSGVASGAAAAGASASAVSGIASAASRALMYSSVFFFDSASNRRRYSSAASSPRFCLMPFSELTELRLFAPNSSISDKTLAAIEPASGDGGEGGTSPVASGVTGVVSPVVAASVGAASGAAGGVSLPPPPKLRARMVSMNSSGEPAASMSSRSNAKSELNVS